MLRKPRRRNQCDGRDHRQRAGMPSPMPHREKPARQALGRLRQRAGSFRSRTRASILRRTRSKRCVQRGRIQARNCAGRLDEANKAVQKALVNQQTNEERIQDTRSDIAEVERRINKRNPSGIAMDDETRPSSSICFRRRTTDSIRTRPSYTKRRTMSKGYWMLAWLKQREPNKMREGEPSWYCNNTSRPGNS